jgi:NAD-dependent dihydropyrimidine dehydrogenase PreA subunit/flavodoxin
MTNAIIVHLSYTGNTLKIAEAIKKGITPLITQTDVVSLRQTDPKSLAGYDLIGIGSPVRLGKMPAELAAFIEDMNGLEGKHCFVFNTHAALPVDFMKAAVTSLRDKGLTVIGFKNWYCAVYLPYVPKPYFTDGHPDEIDLKEAEDFGREMVERSQRIRSGESGLIQRLPEGALYNELYGAKMTGSLPPEVMEARAQGFSVDLNKCTRCGYCVELCPTKSIDFSAEQPVFGPCDQCWLCEQTCPEGAISFNYPPLHRSHNIVVAERFVPALKTAELAGRFRPLVKPEDVGWETPPYVTKKPPRFVVISDNKDNL